MPPGLKVRVRRGLARLLVRWVDAATRGVMRLLGESAASGRAQMSAAELRALVAANTVLDREGRRLIDEVLAAGGRHVRELMVPRTEVVYLDAGMSVADAARLVRQSRHSRFPVVEGTHDDVVGFVHLRDLLIRPDADGVSTVGGLARELRRLPASKRLLPALSEMRREGDHMALVVDEYGGTAGVVTLEDLIEELVGEIHDEYDLEPEPEQVDGVAPSEVDGLLNLNDFAERVGFALPPGPYDTVGGFVMASLGKLPTLGDRVRVAQSRVNGTHPRSGCRRPVPVSCADGRPARGSGRAHPGAGTRAGPTSTARPHGHDRGRPHVVSLRRQKACARSRRPWTGPPSRHRRG